MESNTKYLMAVFSLMLGLSLGVPYLVAETEERHTSWIMWAIFFVILALIFWMWIMREQDSAEEATEEALNAAEDKLKQIEAQAEAQSEAEKPAPVPEPEPEVEEPEPVAEVKTIEPEPVVEATAQTIEVEEEAEPEPEPEPAVEASAEPDDLTQIEGIGPKYAEILTGAGITSFAQVAALSEDEIITVIRSNGGRKSASMGTWAEQAKLAAAGNWDGLAKLQDELSGGRR